MADGAGIDVAGEAVEAGRGALKNLRVLLVDRIHCKRSCGVSAVAKYSLASFGSAW